MPTDFPWTEADAMYLLLVRRADQLRACRSDPAYEEEPEWAAKIGGEVRLLTDETSCEPPSIASLLRQFDENELAMRSKGIDQLDPWRSHK